MIFSFRDETDLRCARSEAEAIHLTELAANLMVNVEEEKKKLSLNLLHEGSFDDLIQNIRALSLQVRSSRASEAEELPRLQSEMEKEKLRAIEEYLVEEEEMEALKARDEKISSENDEMKETLRKKITEEEELKERAGSGVQKLEERKKEVLGRETRAEKTKVALEGEIKETVSRLTKLSKEKSDLAAKLTSTEVSALTKSQELTALIGLKDANLQKLEVEKEKERRLKVKVQLQAEKKALLAEKIQQLKAGGAGRRGEVERERDLLREKTRSTLEEMNHLEQEEASLSKVEQQANTLQQEQSNLEARVKLLEEKTSS